MQCDLVKDDCDPFPQYLIQIILENVPESAYPTKAKIAADDGYPEPKAMWLSHKTQSPEPIPPHKGHTIRQGYEFLPYYNPELTKSEQEELKACVGKERRIQFELFDKNDHLRFKNTLIVRATTYEDKECGTLYETQKLELADQTYLGEPLRTGRLGNCLDIYFDLSKK